MSANDHGLMDALRGGPGALDGWLELRGENEICAAILAAIENADKPTKRELFAAMAMQGICFASPADYTKGQCNEAVAKRAVLVADALLAELAKEQQ
jgi:hypothetical protein